MSKKDFQQYICKPFCAFFREGSKEELACRGALLVDNRVKRGLLNVHTMPVPDRNIDFRGKHDADLDAITCLHCQFKAEDCDFQSEEDKYNAAPCGGYLLLSLLKRAGVISPADIKGEDDDISESG